jgi:hypothetical protein
MWGEALDGATRRHRSLARYAAGVCSTWHTGGLDRRKARREAGLAAANPLQPARKWLCQADLNRSPRLVRPKFRLKIVGVAPVFRAFAWLGAVSVLAA